MCLYVDLCVCILGKGNSHIMGVEKILLLPLTQNQRALVSIGCGVSSVSVSILSMSKILITFSCPRLLFSFLQNITLQWMFMAE